MLSRRIILIIIILVNIGDYSGVAIRFDADYTAAEYLSPRLNISDIAPQDNFTTISIQKFERVVTDLNIRLDDINLRLRNQEITVKLLHTLKKELQDIQESLDFLSASGFSSSDNRIFVRLKTAIPATVARIDQALTRAHSRMGKRNYEKGLHRYGVTDDDSEIMEEFIRAYFTVFFPPEEKRDSGLLIEDTLALTSVKFLSQIYSLINDWDEMELVLSIVSSHIRVGQIKGSQDVVYHMSKMKEVLRRAVILYLDNGPIALEENIEGIVEDVFGPSPRSAYYHRARDKYGVGGRSSLSQLVIDMSPNSDILRPPHRSKKHSNKIPVAEIDGPMTAIASSI